MVSGLTTSLWELVELAVLIITIRLGLVLGRIFTVDEFGEGPDDMVKWRFDEHGP